MRYKKIIGGSSEDAERKYPWLADADFSDAIIDISKEYLVWKDGTWESGWKYAI